MPEPAADNSREPKSEEGFIGAIEITRDEIYFAVHDLKTKLITQSGKANSRDPNQALSNAADFFSLQAAGGAAVKAIGVAAFGVDDSAHSSGIIGKANVPHWSGLNIRKRLCDLTKQALPNLAHNQVFLIQNAAVAAAYKYLSDNPKDETWIVPELSPEGRADSSLLCYVQLDHSLSIGSVERTVQGGGKILYASSRWANLAHLCPPLYTNESYDGCCKYHISVPCFDALVSKRAILARFDKADLAKLSENREALDLISHYVSHLYATIAQIVKPKKIIFGGEVARLLPIEASVRSGFQRITEHFLGVEGLASLEAGKEKKATNLQEGFEWSAQDDKKVADFRPVINGIMNVVGSQILQKRHLLGAAYSQSSSATNNNVFVVHKWASNNTAVPKVKPSTAEDVFRLWRPQGGYAATEDRALGKRVSITDQNSIFSAAELLKNALPRMNDGGVRLALRYSKLGCLQDFELMELVAYEAVSGRMLGRGWGLRNAEYGIALNQTNLPIYRLCNEEYVRLKSASDVLSYVRFFFWHVLGRHGRFDIVEKTEDVQGIWKEDVTVDEAQRLERRLAALLIPLRVDFESGLKEGFWRLATTMLFKDSLLRTTITVNRDGKMDLGDPDFLVDDLPCVPCEYASEPGRNKPEDLIR